MKLLIINILIGSILGTCLAAERNSLTQAEQKAGWKLLFDGKSMEQLEADRDARLVRLLKALYPKEGT